MLELGFTAANVGESEPWIDRRGTSAWNLFSDANFDEPMPWANRREFLVGLSVSLLSVAWICIITRLYTRFFIVKAPWWDDLFVFLYGLSSTLATATMIKAIDFGLGKHFLSLDFVTMTQFLKVFYMTSAAYATSATFIKISLLLQYLRIFERGTTMHRICVIVCGFTALWGLAYSFMAWFPCFPPQNYWNILVTNSSCYGFGSRSVPQLLAAYESHTASNMALDLVVLLIPFQLFWRSKPSWSQRIRLLCLLALATPVFVFASWRFVTIVEHEATTKPVFDPTWYSPLSILLALFEVDAAAICGSIPIFWPQIQKHLDNLNQIRVVQEVLVTREPREFDGSDTDELVLTQPGARASRWSFYRTRKVSSISSTMELDVKETDPGRKKRLHYKDAFIIQQVDPFQSSEGVTEVQAQLSDDNKPQSRQR